jgi:hypothetical protein
MGYYCRCASAGGLLDTNLQLYSLQQAANGWNDLVKTIAARGLDSVDNLKERLTFILSCLGLSLSQLLGQNSPSPDKDKVDQPGKLLQNILVRSHVDPTTQLRLNSTFQEFLEYYDSVRHFGRARNEKKHRTIDRLTTQEVDRFRRMTLEVWDAVIAMYRDDDQNDLHEMNSISDLVPFKNLAE